MPLAAGNKVCLVVLAPAAVCVLLGEEEGARAAQVVRARRLAREHQALHAEPRAWLGLGLGLP